MAIETILVGREFRKGNATDRMINKQNKNTSK